MECSMPGLPVLHYLLEFAQTHVHWITDAIQPSHPLLPLLLLLSIFPSIRVFSSELARCIWWPKCWSFTLASVLPVNIQGWFPLELTGLISLLSKGLSTVFSSTTTQKHQFFGSQFSLIQLSHPYMTIRKTIALTLWTFAGKVMSLLFNTLCSFVIAFLPRRKHCMSSSNCCFFTCIQVSQESGKVVW